MLNNKYKQKCYQKRKLPNYTLRKNAINKIDSKEKNIIMLSFVIYFHYMAITIRNIEKHGYMIDDLKSLTGTSVTTKALIKGGYLAVELGDKLEEEHNKRIQAEEELLRLKAKVQHYFSSQKELVDAIKN
ncbi:hypothetical protein [Photobacterium minamisatsumaniensis]|uniref:hypothetical protein n=1 Tax=Photobacterium minamisatsumaniensis TaxID=2910233 RepID=UPI003D0B3EC0